MNNSDRRSFWIIGLLLICFVFVVYHYETHPEIKYEYVYIDREVEVIKEITKIEIHTVEIPVPFPIYYNKTEIIYIPTNIPLSDWVNEDELKDFIRRDKTDRIEYSADFDCDDFALRTIHNAAEIGRRVYYFYEWTDPNPDNNHIMCMAYVIEEAEYIIWEPQNDMIWGRWSSTVGG